MPATLLLAQVTLAAASAAQAGEPAVGIVMGTSRPHDDPAPLEATEPFARETDAFSCGLAAPRSRRPEARSVFAPGAATSSGLSPKGSAAVGPGAPEANPSRAALTCLGKVSPEPWERPPPVFADGCIRERDGPAREAGTQAA